MKPEEKARLDIDNLLTKAGWVIQDMNEINFGAGLGIAVREYPVKSDSHKMPLAGSGNCPIRTGINTN